MIRKIINFITGRTLENEPSRMKYVWINMSEHKNYKYYQFYVNKKRKN